MSQRATVTTQVQVKQMQMEPASTTELCWLITHWSQAKVLDLNLWRLPVGLAGHTLRDDSEMAAWEARDVKDQLAGLSVLQVT